MRTRRRAVRVALRACRAPLASLWAIVLGVFDGL